MRYFIESLKVTSTIVFIDYNVALEIAKQINLTIVFIDKLNLRLIRVFDYIQRFELELRYKSKKQYIVLNALSCLTSVNVKENALIKRELNTLFIVTFIKIEQDFRDKVVLVYDKDLN